MLNLSSVVDTFLTILTAPLFIQLFAALTLTALIHRGKRTKRGRWKKTNSGVMLLGLGLILLGSALIYHLTAPVQIGPFLPSAETIVIVVTVGGLVLLCQNEMGLSVILGVMGLAFALGIVAPQFVLGLRLDEFIFKLGGYMIEGVIAWL